MHADLLKNIISLSDYRSLMFYFLLPSKNKIYYMYINAF